MKQSKHAAKAELAEAAVPGPHFPESGRFLLSFRHNPVAALQHMAQVYGDVVHLKIRKQNIFLLSHPDDIRDVLVAHHQQMHKPKRQVQEPLAGNGLLRSEDDFYRRQRRLMQPAFHRQRVAAYAQTMIEYTQRTSARWQDGLQVDMAREMMGLTLSIIGQTMFGADVEKDAQEVGEALTTWMQLTSVSRISPLDALLDHLPLPRNKRRGEARTQLDTIISRIIEERISANEDRGDLLSMLLLARDEEEDGRGMTAKQLRDEVMTLFIAGHETTANMLVWTWYLLSQHPEVKQKLQRELEVVLNGRAPTPTDLPHLTYVEMVLSEAMRLYPPAWTIARQTLKNYTLREYLIPADSLLVMSQYVVHHDPRWYPEPLRFDPERWTAAERAKRPKYAYFPFGGGPRLCIGEPFAWMEGELVLATLAQQWHMQLVPGHHVDLEPLITLRPEGGMPMILRRRS
ncbi:MAG: cytochrome P450 [Ktedonobacteraceae bacterium]